MSELNWIYVIVRIPEVVLVWMQIEVLLYKFLTYCSFHMYVAGTLPLVDKQHAHKCEETYIHILWLAQCVGETCELGL